MALRPESLQQFGARARHARLGIALTVTDIACAVGLSDAVYVAIEDGRPWAWVQPGVLAPEFWARLSTVLRVCPATMVGWGSEAPDVAMRRPAPPPPEVSLPRRVFICHPYSGRGTREENIRAVSVIAAAAVQEGYYPQAPILYFPQFVDEDTEREVAIRLCGQMLRMSDEVWQYGNPTAGMRAELALAAELGLPIQRK